MNTFFSVLGRTSLKPMASAVSVHLAVNRRCASTRQLSVRLSPKTLPFPQNEETKSIIKEMRANLLESTQNMVFSVQWILYFVGGYYVQKEKKMVLDVPDLTGFKVTLSVPLLFVA